jgi:hypothetical protein
MQNWNETSSRFNQIISSIFFVIVKSQRKYRTRISKHQPGLTPLILKLLQRRTKESMIELSGKLSKSTVLPEVICWYNIKYYLCFRLSVICDIK